MAWHCSNSGKTAKNFLPCCYHSRVRTISESKYKQNIEITSQNEYSYLCKCGVAMLIKLSLTTIQVAKKLLFVRRRRSVAAKLYFAAATTQGCVKPHKRGPASALLEPCAQDPGTHGSHKFTQMTYECQIIRQGNIK